LIVQWGKFIRDCVMESANITYTLFSPNGQPLRAKIVASFVDRKESKLNSTTSMLSSPDMTHVVIVDKDKLLPLIVYKTYRDQKYYLQVARFNKLKNFRKLKPGSKIILPPLS